LFAVNAQEGGTFVEIENTNVRVSWYLNEALDLGVSVIEFQVLADGTVECKVNGAAKTLDPDGALQPIPTMTAKAILTCTGGGFAWYAWQANVSAPNSTALTAHFTDKYA